MEHDQINKYLSIILKCCTFLTPIIKAVSKTTSNQTLSCTRSERNRIEFSRYH